MNSRIIENKTEELKKFLNIENINDIFESNNFDKAVLWGVRPENRAYAPSILDDISNQNNKLIIDLIKNFFISLDNNIKEYGKANKETIELIKEMNNEFSSIIKSNIFDNETNLKILNRLFANCDWIYKISEQNKNYFEKDRLDKKIALGIGIGLLGGLAVFFLNSLKPIKDVGESSKDLISLLKNFK